MPFSEALRQYNSAMDRGQRRRSQEAQANRQHTMDLFTIKRAQEQDARAVEQHEESMRSSRLLNEEQERIVNTNALTRLGQAGAALVDPQTGQMTSDPLRHQQYTDDMNRTLATDTRARDYLTAQVGTMTGGKYDGMEIESLSRYGQGGFAIRFKNSNTGEEGVMTENGTTDPNDNVLVLEGEDVNKFAELTMRLSRSVAPPEIFTTMLGGGTGRREQSHLMEDFTAAEIAGAIDLVVEGNPEMPVEQVVEMATDLLDSGEYEYDPATDPITARMLQEEAEGSGGLPQPEQPRDPREIPAMMRGIEGRRNQSNESLGIMPMRERHVINTPESEPEPEPEPELRVGQKINRELTSEQGFNKRAGRLSNDASVNFLEGTYKAVKGAFFVEPIKQFVSDVLGIESDNPETAGVEPNPNARPAQIPDPKSENYTQELEQAATDAQNGSVRPNATHRGSIKKVVEGTSQPNANDYARTAYYLFASGHLDIAQAERLAKTGTVDPLTLNYADGQAGAARKLVDAQNRNRRDAVEQLIRSDSDLNKTMIDMVNHALDRVELPDGFWPGIERDVQHVIATVIGGAGQFGFDENGHAVFNGPSPDELRVLLGSPATRGNLAAAVSRTARMYQNAPKRNKPDLGVLLTHNFISEASGVSAEANPTDENLRVGLLMEVSKEEGMDVDLMLRATRTLQSMRVKEGLSYRQITPKMIIEAMVDEQQQRR